MPIVACGSCGKGLNLKPGLIGKRVKCPWCKQGFTAVEGGAAVVAPRSSSRGTPKAKGSEKSPSLHISPKVIILTAFAIIIPGIIIAWILGPGAVHSAWTKQESEAKDEVSAVVTHVIQSYMSNNGGYNPRKSRKAPSVIDVEFDFNSIHMTMPDSMTFRGTSSEGIFEGKFNPKTHEIKAEVELGGMVLSTGVGRRGNKTINATGRMIDGKLTAEIDGKKAEIYYPPKSDDDE